MQDEINEKVIALSIRTTKLTAEMLQKSIRFMLSQIKKQLDKPVQHHGKQTLKQLMKQNAGVSSIEITDSNIKAFESTAKKYGVDFALKKDATEMPGGRKTVKSKNGENLVFSRGGVTLVTPFPFSSAHSEG